MTARYLKRESRDRGRPRETGTPEGVNAVVARDLMRGEIQELGAIEVLVKA